MNGDRKIIHHEKDDNGRAFIQQTMRAVERSVSAARYRPALFSAVWLYRAAPYG